MDVSQSYLSIALILFIVNILLLFIIIAPILFQVFFILKKFNNLLGNLENLSQELNKKGKEFISVVTGKQLVRLIKNLFSKKDSKK